jgi:hypothetical protein
MPQPGPIQGEFFRCVHASNPAQHDLRSNQEKGRPRQRGELHDDWEYAGLSVFRTFAAAAAKTRALNGALGWYVARIRVPPGSGVTGRCSAQTAHCTIGPPTGQTASVCFWPMYVDTRPVPRLS